MKPLRLAVLLIRVQRPFGIIPSDPDIHNLTSLQIEDHNTKQNKTKNNNNKKKRQFQSDTLDHFGHATFPFFLSRLD
jgi:hypothetical protein